MATHKGTADCNENCVEEGNTWGQSDGCHRLLQRQSVIEVDGWNCPYIQLGYTGFFT